MRGGRARGRRRLYRAGGLGFAAILWQALIACSLRRTEEPPECKSEAWIEAVADAHCRRLELCWPDSEFRREYDVCVEAERTSLSSLVGHEGVYSGGDSGLGHGACAHFFNCDYPLGPDADCPRPFPEAVHGDCLD